MMKTGKVVLGAMAGLAIGAIAGIIFAPEKGTVTRKQLLDKGDDYVDKLKFKFDEISDSLAEKLKSTKMNAERLVDNGMDKFDNTKKDVENTVSNFYHDATTDNKHIS